MGLGVYPVVPHLSMMMARRQSRHEAPPGQLRSVAREWAISVAMSATRPVGLLGLPTKIGVANGPRPIIVLHGYAMGRACFLPLSRRLGKAGLGPVLGFEYWSLGPIANAARRLSAYVDEVCDTLGTPEVDLIGHSMGGVVSRYYVTLYDGSPRVRNLITVGSPHRGTEVSAVGIGRPHKELFPDSPLMQRLASAPLPKDTRMTVVWSRSDALVAPSRARVPGTEEVVFDDLGHLTMLVNPRVAEALIARLRI